MARADYYGAEAGIKSVLAAYATTNGLTWWIDIERLPAFDPQAGDKLFIYCESRDAPADQQRIRAGRSTNFMVTFSVWCWSFAGEIEQAARQRDDLMGHVEIALMGDRTLNNTVTTCWLEGGSFLSMDSGAGMFMGGEVRITADMRALT